MIPEYMAGVWRDLCVAMKKEWRDSDFTQRQRSHEYLQALVEQGCSDMASVKSFCRQFKTISSALIVTHKLDALTQALWFLKALPEELREACDP